MAAIFISILVVCLTLSGLRFWAIYRGFHGKWPGELVASVLLQITGVFAVTALLTGEPSLLLLVGVPELGLAWIFDIAQRWWDFLAPSAVLPTIGTALLCAALFWKGFGRYVIGLGGLFWLATFLVVGDVRSKSQMCATARALGVTQIKRNSLLWSISNAPREFQIELHAEIVRDDARLGWSYGEQDWYRVPDTIFARVAHDAVTICPA